MVKNQRIRSCDLDLWPWNSPGFVRLPRNMFTQNFIDLTIYLGYREKTPTKTIQPVARARAVNNYNQNWEKNWNEEKTVKIYSKDCLNAWNWFWFRLHEAQNITATQSTASSGLTTWEKYIVVTLQTRRIRRPSADISCGRPLAADQQHLLIPNCNLHTSRVYAKYSSFQAGFCKLIVWPFNWTRNLS